MGAADLLSGEDLSEHQSLQNLLKREKEIHQQELGTAAGKRPTHQELLASWPDGKSVVVARHQVFSDGTYEPVEAWRPPTKAEEGGFPKSTILQGGVVDVAAPAPAPWPWWKKALVGVAGAASVAGVGFGVYTLATDGGEDTEEEEEEDLDESADDDDDESEDDEE